MLIDGMARRLSRMTSLAVVKFGGSAMGPDGSSLPDVVQRITDMKADSKLVCVFSAPLAARDGGAVSITDMVLEMGARAESGLGHDLGPVRHVYDNILELVGPEHRDECRGMVDGFLQRAGKALDEAGERREFADETRSNALAFSGEILMAHVADLILRSRGIKSAAVPFDSWPIITDQNIESTNFLYSESAERMHVLEELVDANDVVTIGGFIGRTINGTTTTYERGGSDRTAADLGILLHKKYDARIDFEKDSAVVSADPKIVAEGLSGVGQLSYNEARLAGMFGMKILDPIAIKEILENGVDIPITISEMKRPQNVTTIKRVTDDRGGHPLKIVTGKRNCAIFRIESDAAPRLLASLREERRYSEFIVLSPFTRDGIEFTRILFLDADYIRRNEKYFLGFDSLATITYNRGVVTLIGDEMWRVQQIASRSSAKLGAVGLNILNMDAQEETSRIIMVVEDSGQNIPDAIRAIHSERPHIKFI